MGSLLKALQGFNQEMARFILTGRTDCQESISSIIQAVGIIPPLAVIGNFLAGYRIHLLKARSCFLHISLFHNLLHNLAARDTFSFPSAHTEPYVM